jgi:hypothetical protein
MLHPAPAAVAAPVHPPRRRTCSIAGIITSTIEIEGGRDRGRGRARRRAAVRPLRGGKLRRSIHLNVRINIVLFRGRGFHDFRTFLRIIQDEMECTIKAN